MDKWAASLITEQKSQLHRETAFECLCSMSWESMSVAVSWQRSQPHFISKASSGDFLWNCTDWIFVALDHVCTLEALDYVCSLVRQSKNVCFTIQQLTWNAARTPGVPGLLASAGYVPSPPQSPLEPWCSLPSTHLSDLGGRDDSKQ